MLALISVVLLARVAMAIDIVDPIEADHISPVAIFVHSLEESLLPIERIIDRNLATFGLFYDDTPPPGPSTDPPTTGHVIFDMGAGFKFGSFVWWNRPTSNDLAAENVDFYIFAGDVPYDSDDIEGDPNLILVDNFALCLRQHETANCPGGTRNNEQVFREEHVFTSPFTARYIGMRMNDEQLKPGNERDHNLQFGEIAFTPPDLNACCPSPGDGNSVLYGGLVLGWTAGPNATDHDVYFGTAWGDVNSAGRGSPSYRTNKPLGDETYNVGMLEALVEGETYYWRIDANDPVNTYKGGVWSFSTIDPAQGIVVLLRTIDVQGFGAWTLRVGDLSGNGQADFLLVRNSGQDIKCLTAIEPNGTQLWQVGEPSDGGYSISYDLAVQIYDIDLDGYNEVIYAAAGEQKLKILNGQDGTLKQEGPLPSSDATDCIVIANFGGRAEARDILVKNRYGKAWALDPNLDVLWSYSTTTGHYPWPYDFDGDGRDELMLGYTLVDDDGSKIWKSALAGHADAVAIGDVDGNSLNGAEIALAASSGDDKFVLLDRDGQTLWQHSVDHAQHIIVGDFRPELPGLEVCGLDRGNDRSATGVDAMILYSADGTELWREVRTDPGINRWITIISMVDNWDGSGRDLILGYRRGGSTSPTLYDGYGEVVATFPFVALEQQHFAQHADIWGDEREEIIVYNENWIYIYTNGTANQKKRQYNFTGYIGMP